MSIAHRAIKDVFTKLGNDHLMIWMSGKRTGEYKIWWSDGQLEEHGFFRNNNPHGQVRKWIKPGRNVYDRFFDNGDQINLPTDKIKPDYILGGDGKYYKD